MTLKKVTLHSGVTTTRSLTHEWCSFNNFPFFTSSNCFGSGHWMCQDKCVSQMMMISDHQFLCLIWLHQLVISTQCVCQISVLSLLSILINHKRLKFGFQHLQLQHFSSLLFGFVSLSDSIFAKSSNYISWHKQIQRLWLSQPNISSSSSSSSSRSPLSSLSP